MSELLGKMRLFFILLAIFTIGRWSLSLAGVPYEKAHQVFSLVILTILASVHHAALLRAFEGRRFWPAVGLGVAFAVCSQLVILLSTVVSYMAGMQTYFNHPIALNLTEPVSLGQAFAIRLQGLLANSVLNGVAAALGWLMGAAWPKGRP